MSYNWNGMAKNLNALINKGQDLGAQLCVYHEGKLVLDLAVGKMAEDNETPVTHDTLFPVFSVTKGFVAGAAHILAEKGLYDYDTKICEVWPEFAANGKENATIRHALSHLTGVSRMPKGILPEDILSWDKMCSLIAEMPPKNPPGEYYDYHAITFGWVVGEIMRRIDGRNIETIVKEEICDPLGIKDFFIGLPEKEANRVATLYEPHANITTADENVSDFMRPFTNWMNSRIGQQAVMPGACGITNARSIARYYASLLPGGVDGIELLPQSRIKTATSFYSIGEDASGGMTLGFGVHRLHQNKKAAAPPLLLSEGSGNCNCNFLQPEKTRLPNFGHNGYGGAYGMAYPEHNIAIGFTKNLFTAVDSCGELLNSLLG